MLLCCYETYECAHNDNQFGNTSKQIKDINEFINGRQIIKGKKNYYKSVSTLDIYHSDDIKCPSQLSPFLFWL